MQLRKHRRWDVKCRNWNVNVCLEDVFAWRRNKNDTYVIRQVLFCRTIYLFRWPCGNLRHVFLSQKLFCQYDQGIDKTLALAKTCPADVCALCRLSFWRLVPPTSLGYLLSLKWVHFHWLCYTWTSDSLLSATQYHPRTLRPTHFPPHPYWDHTPSVRSRGKNNLMKQPNKPFCSIDLIYGDFSDMIIFETGTCCILIQLDWNSINQNKTIVGIRMLYPNRN